MYGESLWVNRNRSGWNTYVRIKFEESCRALLTGRCAGSPRNYILADDIRRKRAVFKLSMRRCKKEANLMWAEALTSKLRLGKVVTFWKEVKAMTGCGRKLVPIS